VRHELRQFITRDKELRVQVISTIQRELVVFANLPVRIEQALNGLAHGIELTGRGEEANGVPQRQRFRLAPEHFQRPQCFSNERTVAWVEDVQSELIDVWVLNNELQEPHSHVQRRNARRCY